MSLMTWNPFREMDYLMSRYQRVLGRPFAMEGDGEIQLTSWTPAVDISETDKEYLVKAELPGIKKEEVKVSVHNGMLTLEGERKVERESKGEKYHRVESYFGSFSRSFSLPENVNADKITADSKDGVLCIHLPKAEARKPKAIEVKVN